MSFYIDTSALIPALVSETGTPLIMAWLRGQTPGSIFISEWTHTEVASALSLKVRTGELTLELRADALTVWNHLHRANLPTLAVLSDHFETAARFAGQPSLGLRAGDALHLAIAAAGGHTLVTLDRAMATAATAIGVPVEPL